MNMIRNAVKKSNKITLLTSIAILIFSGNLAAEQFGGKTGYHKVTYPNFKSGPSDAEYSATSDTLDLAVQQFQDTEYDEYRISPGDGIFINVLNAPEVTGAYTIGPDGKKTIPVAGVIDFSDLTRDQAAERVSQALRPNYQTKLSVTVRVDQYTGNRYYILGDVPNPGVKTFPYRPTLLDLIAEAGGIPAPQNKPSGEQAPKPYDVYCTVTRAGNKLDKIHLSRLIYESDHSLNVLLQQHDIVNVHGVETAPLYIFGEIGRQGYYNVTPNMTLLDAITQAGGFRVDSAHWKIEVIHMNSFTKEKIKMRDIMEPDPNMDIVLEPGDIIYVPRNILAKFNYFISQINPFRGIPGLGL